MTSRFPGPWQIAELPNGFAVHDANGRHLGFFYGRTDPNKAGHGDFLMIDDARQIAVDFAMLPELLNLISDRSEVATSKADDKLSRPETNRSPPGGNVAFTSVGRAKASANVASANRSTLNFDRIIDSGRSRRIVCGLSLLWRF